MPEELLREIRKLEIRLEDYLKQEKEFVRELRNCLSKFGELNNSMERSKTNAEDLEKLMNLRFEAFKAFSEALKRESMAEHEKSHLLESYGARILSLEKEFRNFGHPLDT